MTYDLVAISSGFGQAAMTVAVLGLAIVSFLTQVRDTGTLPPENFKRDTKMVIRAALFTVGLWCLISIIVSIFDENTDSWISTIAAVAVLLQALATIFFSILLGKLTFRALEKIK